MAERKPVVSDPSDPKAWCAKAAELVQKGDNKGALYCYEQAVRFYPKDATDKGAADVWFNIGCLYEKTGQREAAAGCFGVSAKRFVNDFRFFAEYARLLALLGKYDDAALAADKALEVNPSSALLYANKAGYLIFAGKAGEALAACDKAIELDALCASGYLHKAHALVVLGCEADAVFVLEGGLEKIPDEPRLLKMLANVAVRAKMFEKALAAADKLVTIAESDDAAWSLKGAALAYLGRKNEAVEAFSKAVRLNPREKSHRMNLAAVRKQ